MNKIEEFEKDMDKRKPIRNAVILLLVVHLGNRWLLGEALPDYIDSLLRWTLFVGMTVHLRAGITLFFKYGFKD